MVEIINQRQNNNILSGNFIRKHDHKKKSFSWSNVKYVNCFLDIKGVVYGECAPQSK